MTSFNEVRKKKEIQNNQKKKEEKGITLIALVITIIVLILLAMVTIATLTGPNGLLNKSSEAKIENSHGEVRERLQLETNAYLSEKLEGKYTGDLLKYLQEKGFVDKETNKVLIDNLSQGGKSIITGKGTGETDIYKLEEKTEATGNTTKLASTEVVKIAASENNSVKEYSINYYDENGNKKEIGLLEDKLGQKSTSSVESETAMINFTIDETPYTLPKGSTWQDFYESVKSEQKTFYPNEEYDKSPVTANVWRTLYMSSYGSRREFLVKIIAGWWGDDYPHSFKGYVYKVVCKGKDIGNSAVDPTSPIEENSSYYLIGSIYR